MKAGPRTTEFWKSVAATTACLFLIVYGAFKGDTVMVVGGAAGLGLTSAGYSVGRGMAKGKQT